MLKSHDKYISRDEVRFSFLKDGDDYFAKEKEAFAEFISQINNAIEENYKCIYIDATHLNPSSRAKVINKLQGNVEKIGVIYLDTPLDICLERNSTRTGRQLVPEKSIREMYDCLSIPTAEENRIDTFIRVPYGKRIEIKEFIR